MPAAFLASALIQFVLGLVVAWLLGPAEFGYYALALAGAVLVQTFVFEWLRLAATRFHHVEAGGLSRLFCCGGSRGSRLPCLSWRWLSPSSAANVACFTCWPC